MLGVYLICATYRHILDVVARLSVIGFQEKKISPRGAGFYMSGISDRPSIARCGLALAISRVVGAISTIAAILEIDRCPGESGWPMMRGILADSS
jgi:hypothetical protein